MATSQDHNSTAGVWRKLAAVHREVARRQFLGANNGNVIRRPDYEDGRSPPRFHFQGIQRRGLYLFVSAGQKHLLGTTSSQLIVVKMGSRSASSAWSVPEYFPPGSAHSYENPHPCDRVLAVADLDRRLWHAGGIQMMGNRLAVPIYGGGGSQVRVYDFGTLLGELSQSPLDLQALVARSPFSTICTRGLKPRAVALACLPSGTPLAVVWDDAHLHFYHEIGNNWLPRGRVDASQVNGFDHMRWLRLGREYQSINLLLDTSSAAYPLFYLIAFRNDSLLESGNNCADVYAFSPLLDPAKPVKDVSPTGDTQGFVPVPCLIMRMGVAHGQREQYNFSAAAGLHLLADGGILIYSAPHKLHRGSKRLNFNEFAKR